MAFYQNQQDNIIRYSTIFSTNTRSLVILRSGTTTYGHFLDASSNYDNEKIYRKYYSKKIANLVTYFKDSSSASAHRCKNAKNLKIYGSALKRTPITSAKALSLYYGIKFILIHRDFDPTLKPNCPTFVSQLSGYKSLETFIFHSGLHSISLCQLRALPHLRSVSLTVNKHQLVANAKTLLSLCALESFSLNLRNQNMISKSYLEEIVDFCINIMALKTIKSVTLSFLSIIFDESPKLFETLIDGVNKTKPVLLDISLIFPVCKNYDAIIDQLQSTLEYIDLLTLRFQSGYALGVNNKSCTDQKETSSSLAHAQRKLDVVVPLQMNLIEKASLNQPTHKLFQNMSNLFGKIMAVPFTFQETLNFQNLQTFTFNFPTQYTETISEGLANVLKESKSLKHLSLTGFRIPRFDNMQNTEVRVPVLDEISSLNNLENLYLQDFGVSVDSLSLIEKALSPLNNLKLLFLLLNVEASNELKHDISLSIEPLVNLTALLVGFTLLKGFSERVNLCFPLETFSHLTNLQIVLPNLNKESQLGFVRSLGKLASLEDLGIQEPTKMLRDKNVRPVFFHELYNLRKLKAVSINDMLEYRIQVPNKNTNLDEKKRFAGKIKKYGEELLRRNRNIERFVASDRENYEIKVMRQ